MDKTKNGLSFIILVVNLVFLVPSASATQDVTKVKTQMLDEKKEKTTDNIVEWGSWGNTEYGVGVRGKLEEELNKLDRSNLLEDPSGVSSLDSKSSIKNKKNLSQPKNIKKMMEQLKAMEKKLRRELDNDSEI
jgi:hypothetical protein